MHTQTPAAFDPAMDGVDHINVYSRGRTGLGRVLTNFAHTPFTVPEHGTFASVEGYWYWLQCPAGAARERLRPLHGHRAKQIGRELRILESIEYFRAKLRGAGARAGRTAEANGRTGPTDPVPAAPGARA